MSNIVSGEVIVGKLNEIALALNAWNQGQISAHETLLRVEAVVDGYLPRVVRVDTHHPEVNT